MQRRNREIGEAKTSDRVRTSSGQGCHGEILDFRLEVKVIGFSFSTLLGSRCSGERIPQSLRTQVKRNRKDERISKLTRDARSCEIKQWFREGFDKPNLGLGFGQGVHLFLYRGIQVKVSLKGGL